jgi:hypothetical protein
VSCSGSKEGKQNGEVETSVSTDTLETADMEIAEFPEKEEMFETDAAVEDETAPDKESENKIPEVAEVTETEIEIMDASEISSDIEIDCPPKNEFDYTCEIGMPDTCPEGICLYNLCIGPVLDPHRWDKCGDGLCEPCETKEDCPADCGQMPVMTGKKSYDNDKTITVWIHGFINESPDKLKTMVYGEADGCGGILTDMKAYGVTNPCGSTPETEKLPDHMIKVEYYGDVPDKWLSKADVDEIEKYPYSQTTEGLHRFSLIVAKFIKHRLEISGAEYAKIACHSMGCLIARFIIEHDLENLASGNHITRWFTSAGVIAGARLARLYDNPTVQQVSSLIGLEVSYFIFMNPDYVQDKVAVWDHKLYEGNNPLFAGMIINHIAGTDPALKEALNIKLLDLNNPGDEPNDGIMFTFDEYFHSQKSGITAPSGDFVSSSRSYVFQEHMDVPDTDAAIVLATATLFHKKKVIITLKETELYKDRENHTLFDGENGKPPAEIIVETEVRYNPYIKDTFGKDVLIHDDKLSYRTPEMFTQQKDTIMAPNLVIYSGPVFDQMTSIKLSINVLEADWYQRMKLYEWLFDPDQELIGYAGQIELKNQEFEIKNDYMRCKIEVKLVDLY